MTCLESQPCRLRLVNYITKIYPKAIMYIIIIIVYACLIIILWTYFIKIKGSMREKKKKDTSCSVSSAKNLLVQYNKNKNIITGSFKPSVNTRIVHGSVLMRFLWTFNSGALYSSTGSERFIHVYISDSVTCSFTLLVWNIRSKMMTLHLKKNHCVIQSQHEKECFNDSLYTATTCTQ